MFSLKRVLTKQCASDCPGRIVWPVWRTPDNMKPTLRLVLALLAFNSAFCLIPESRHADPVILRGPDLPELLGQDPNMVVGFRFSDAAVSWEQIPVQIDEMHLQEWLVIKQGDCR